MGSGGVLVLGEGAAASRRKRAFPSHALGELWVLAPGLHPAPPGALGKASRHTQAHAPRPKESGTHSQLLWQPRGSFHSPPRRSPRHLPELQPTGLCASQERAIKPALWRWPGASPTWSGASRANLRPGKGL